MRRNAILFVLILVSTSLNAAQTCEKIIVGAHPDYAPFHWVDNGVYTGASIAITKDILNDMSVPWDITYVGPWMRVLKYAYEGKIDLIPALKKTPDRERYLIYTSTPFYQNPVGIFMRQGAKSIKQLTELKGLIGSINVGDKHGGKLDSFIKTQHIIQVHGLQNNFAILDKGRTDYFIIGLKTATMFLNQHQLNDKFSLVYTTDDTLVHHAFSRRSPCAYLVNEFSQRLQQKIINGAVEEKIQRFDQIWRTQQHK